MIEISPYEWGPITWFIIHSVNIKNVSDKKIIKKFLIDIANIIPCDNCSYHMKKLILIGHPASNIKPLDFYINDKDDYFVWSYLFHDCVNKLRKKNIHSPNIRLVKNYYYNIKPAQKEVIMHKFLNIVTKYDKCDEKSYNSVITMYKLFLK